ncbi:IS1634 family transposase [Thermodesulfobacteriota bacterium]
MFIRTKKLKYKDKTYTNYQLVESFHTPKGPRRKVICSLGNLKPRPKADWLKLAHKVESALVGQMDMLEKEDQEVSDIVVKIRERTFFNPDHEIFLYDLTSTYFEGASLENSKAKLGYSRDKRPDCKQVLVGLVVNRDGFPLAHEIFEGNIRDHKTLPDMLDQLGKRVSLQPGRTVVVDRGMAFDENLKQIKAHGLRYLVASRQKERDQWLEELEDGLGFAEIRHTPSPTNPCQKKTPVKVKMKRTDDETHILCLSAGRKEKDRAIRGWLDTIA